MDNHQNGQDSVYVPASFNRQDVLDYYKWEISQIRLFLTSQEIFALPEESAPLLTEETPDIFRRVITGMGYQPGGPFDSTQSGVFYVRPLPEKLEGPQQVARYRYVNRRGLLGSLVREGYPGRHLQCWVSASNPDQVRRWQKNILFEEGWASYVEELAYHKGLYGHDNPTRWLEILDRARHEAALAVADIRFHAGQTTFDETVEWLATVLDAETESAMRHIRREVLDLSWQPTKALGAPLGKTELVHLRQAGIDNLGTGFSLREFHDQVLSEGAVPPAVLEEILGFNTQ
jgi:uncharacterized protein (DUF885 family)